MMSIDPENVFAQVEADRASGELPDKVTAATIVYQASDRFGVIEKINRETGVRNLGNWQAGTFIPLTDDA